MINDQIAVSERALLIDRIAQSELFCKSPRLREFLSYVADCTLSERIPETREQVIAERVFGRKPELNGGGDSIVRTEARNLRKRLDLYFENEGKNEPLVVNMPKGGYVLEFRTRELLKQTPGGGMEPAAVQPSSPLAHSGKRPSNATLSRYRMLCLLLAVSVAGLSGLAWHLYSEKTYWMSKLETGRTTLPFSALFSGDRSPLIVTSDTGLMQISSLAGRRITLNEYMARSYPPMKGTQPPDLVNRWNVFEFTDGREMAIAGTILQKNLRYAHQIRLLSGHQVQLQDFENHSAILIGSLVSNPWAQLFEGKLNFPCDLLPDGRIVFKNPLPRPGESSEFPTASDSAHERSFARIAFLPDMNGDPPALLIAGTTAQLTKVAGDFVNDTKRFEVTLRSIGINPAGPPRFFEILIRSNTFVSGATLPEVVASRTRSPAS